MRLSPWRSTGPRQKGLRPLHAGPSQRGSKGLAPEGLGSRCLVTHSSIPGRACRSPRPCPGRNHERPARVFLAVGWKTATSSLRIFRVPAKTWDGAFSRASSLYAEDRLNPVARTRSTTVHQPSSAGGREALRDRTYAFGFPGRTRRTEPTLSMKTSGLGEEQARIPAPSRIVCRFSQDGILASRMLMVGPMDLSWQGPAVPGQPFREEVGTRRRA
jgi:hypothetical protein